jgi:hypothetical protein
MPGFAFHWETLKQAGASLSGSGDEATAELLSSPYAALGALGPDILEAPGMIVGDSGLSGAHGFFG